MKIATSSPKGPLGVVALASCVLACTSAVALIILMSLLATSKSTNRRSSNHDVALGAAVLDIIALATLMVSALVLSMRPNIFSLAQRSRQSLLILVATLPALVAVLVTIAALAQICAEHASEERSVLGTAFGMWCISVLSQAVLYAILFSTAGSRSQASTDAAERPPESSPNHKTSTSVAMSILPPPPRLQSAPLSPRLSGHSSPRSSIRESIQHVLSPMGSRTRLLRQASFQSDKGPYTDPPIPPVREADGFETWEVDSEADEAAASRPRLRLETIPQSRPVSPAHALDGPFPESDYDVLPENLPLPESPVLLNDPSSQVATYSPASHSPMTGRFPFPNSRRPSANDQSHIHPLFRTDSPAPPPAASPGTIVTASPYGGQFISDPEQAASLTRPGSRQTSRPGSPNMPSTPRLRESSIKSNKHPLREDSVMDMDGGEKRKITPPMLEAMAMHRRQSST